MEKIIVFLPHFCKPQLTHCCACKTLSNIVRRSTILHPPTHPSVVVDRISLERFFSDQFGDYPELWLFLERFQEFRRSVRLFQVGLPRTGVGTVDPSLGDALQVKCLLIIFLVAQSIGCGIGVVQDHKGRLVALCERGLEAIPGFFSAGINDDAGVGLTAVGVDGVSSISPVGSLYGTDFGDSSLVLDILVVDGIS